MRWRAVCGAAAVLLVSAAAAAAVLLLHLYQGAAVFIEIIAQGLENSP